MEKPVSGKPPSKEEILLEWFLADSKEIVTELKEAVASATAVRESMIEAAGNLGLTVGTAQEELVQAHRALVGVIREAESKQRSSMDRFHQQSRKSVEGVVTRCLIIAGVCAGMGGALGGAVAAFFLR
ncbi:plasmid stabilization protein StbC [Pseudomonas syringae pv. actinidiae]|nr:plasmid stabilization protein StbC [Pseudomonas syringae pv. actinidiae]